MAIIRTLILIVSLLGFTTALSQPAVNTEFATVQAQASKGDPKAEFQLAHIYEFGVGVPKDINNALLWYQKSAATGYVPAQMRLGFIYQTGAGVPIDYAQAIKWYQMAFTAGNPKEWTNMAMIYKTGDKTFPKDYSKAFQLFQLAADKNIALAQYNLGVMYLYAFGIPKDETKAAQWFQQSAQLGLANGEFFYGYVYYKGMGVPMDLIKAYVWISLAMAQSNELDFPFRKNAVAILADIKARITPDQLKQAQALTAEYLKKFKPNTQYKTGN